MTRMYSYLANLEPVSIRCISLRCRDMATVAPGGAAAARLATLEHALHRGVGGQDVALWQTNRRCGRLIGSRRGGRDCMPMIGMRGVRERAE